MALLASEANISFGRFGFELEAFGDPDTAVNRMVRKGFIDSAFLDGRPRGEDDCDCEDCFNEVGGLHMYHCDCSLCDYRRDSGLLAAQEDCSVDMEFVSRILSIHSASDMEELARFDDEFESIVERNWHTPGHGAGNHVHVGRRNLDTSAVGWVRVHHGLFTENWQWVAGAGTRIRSYNGVEKKLDVRDAGGHVVSNHWDYSSSWLSDRYETFEYRLWNSPNKAGFIPFHINVSLATTRWAAVMADRYPNATIAQVADVTGTDWKKSFFQIAMFLDHRIPGSAGHEDKLMDLAKRGV